MTLGTFKKLIELESTHSKRINDAYKLNIDLVNFCEDIENMIALMWKEVLNEEGIGWYEWYLYEKDGREDFKAWDKDGNEILRNVEELYQYLVDSKCFKL